MPTQRTMRAALLLLGVMMSGAALAQAAFGPTPGPPAASEFHIGALRVTALHDAQFVFPNDGKLFGGGAEVTAVTELLRSAGAPTDRITLSVNSLLVRSGKRLLLLDSGLGSKNHGALLASLHEARVAPTAITDVLITHSHGDHIGGLVDDGGTLVFPKAAIRMAAAEWAWLQKQGPADVVGAVAPRVETFEPGALIAPGVKSVALDGHTPGHVGYELASGDTRLLDIGDMAHSSIISLAKPEWTISFDTDSALASATRLRTLNALAKDDEWVFAPHFPFPGVGHIAVSGSAFVWKPGVP